MIDLFNPDKAALLQKWAHVIAQVRPISQWTSDLEIAWLCEAAEGKDVVGEIGSYKGKSARAMCLAGAHRVYCTDRFQDGTEEVFCDRLKDFLEAGTVRLCNEESHEGAQRIMLGTCDRFDFFFIDASHSKEDVIRDINIWLKLMKQGSILAFHDCHPNDPDNGVSQALQTIFPTHIICVDSIAAVQL